MTKTHFVDVAMVTYNHEAFVAQAIESVLAQEIDFECRLIIGDDCSTDGTQSILEDYAQKYPRRIATIFSSEHLGLAHKDRVGLRVIESCTAKYIAFLDGDDYWTDPLKLKKQVAFLESHADFAICCHNATMVYEDGSKEPANQIPPDYREVSTLEDLLFVNFIPTCSAVFRRGLFGEFPDWFHTLVVGDWPLHIMNARHGKIRYFNEVMAAYRVHGAGVWTSTSPINQRLEVIKMLNHLNGYLDYKYRKQIRAAKAEWYYQLAQISYGEGDQSLGRTYLKLHLRFGGLQQRRNVLSILLRRRAPMVYRSLRALRDWLFRQPLKQ
jgi:glycosyltransferase involved in cell wall biosynthesis